MCFRALRVIRIGLMHLLCHTQRAVCTTQLGGTMVKPVLVDAGGVKRWYGNYPSMWLAPDDLLEEATSHL
ncbi:hypothetical protein GCM10009785_15130 [Brooklawnia cerclae]